MSPHAGPIRRAVRAVHTGRRRSALVAALLAALLVGTLLPATAQTPEQRKREIQRQLAGAKEELGHSTWRLTKATQRFNAAQAALPGAQAALAEARGELIAAQAADAAAQEKLAEAERSVTAAERRVADLSGKIVEQRERMGQLAATAYRGSGLSTLTVALTAENPTELTRNLEAVQSVLRSEGSIADNLADDRADLATERASLEGLRRVAEDQREEAARALERTRELEAAAQQRAEEVAALVRERRAAMAEAQAAKAEDARRYQKLVAERERIERLIKERIRRERLRQLREARERAAREAREARERAARERARRHDSGSGSSAAGSSGGGSSSSSLFWPLSEIYVTSPYGMRVHPITGVYKLHDGTDMSAGCGTPVYAAESGTVVWANDQGAYGKQVLIDHGIVNGRSLMTSYSHLNGFSTYSGERVSRGELIAFAGTTGYSTGCHLHFMVYRDGGTVDPMGWL